MPPSQQATYPGTYTRIVDVYGQIGNVFDGTTFNQSLLVAGLALNGTFAHHVYDLASGTQLTRLDGTYSSATVSAQP